MKKRAWLICILCILILITGLRYKLIDERNVWLRIGDDGMLYTQFIIDQRKEQLFPWKDKQDDEVVYFFFLPAFVGEHKIWYDKDSVEIYENGKKTGENGCLRWKDDEVYQIKVLGEEQEETSEQNVIFMKSENLPAVFIGTTSGSMDYLHQSKENEEQGYIEIVSEQGNTEYRGQIPRISGRGNYSWEYYEKKSYSFSLKSAQPLCGLNKGKKWNLLALARERTKLSTKLAMDIGTILEMEYSPQGTWVDLYLNGQYAGDYFLAESVSVGEGRVEIYDLEEDNEQMNPDIESAESFAEDGIKGYEIISGKTSEGGYLLEYDAIYYQKRTNGFVTNNDHKFVIREPAHASRDQLSYIKDYVQNVENVLHGQVADYRDYIDQDSFVSKFLVEEITKNYDAYCTSTFFYKDRDDDLLYAGPIWDYDGAWGIINFDHSWENPDGLIEDELRKDGIDWFVLLYDNDSFYREIAAQYTEILPALETMIDSGIDEYADTIRQSVRMDEMRWRNSWADDSGNYTAYENNVKFLKSFFARRLNYLNRKWEIPYREFEVPSDGTVHEVLFYKDGEMIDRREILDGGQIENEPELDEGKYEGWRFVINGKTRYWSSSGRLPIYEDLVLNAKMID